jgi:hypothetical protein
VKKLSNPTKTFLENFSIKASINKSSKKIVFVILVKMSKASFCELTPEFLAGGFTLLNIKIGISETRKPELRITE